MHNQAIVWGAQVHHGAVLGLAEVILAVHMLGQQQQAPAQHQLSEEQKDSIAQLPHALQAAMFLRGKGGEIMRAALCR